MLFFYIWSQHVLKFPKLGKSNIETVKVCSSLTMFVRKQLNCIVVFISNKSSYEFITYNCDLLVLGPELAMLRIPRPVWDKFTLNSSANGVGPHDDSPPFPVPVGSPPWIWLRKTILKIYWKCRMFTHFEFEFVYLLTHYSYKYKYTYNTFLKSQVQWYNLKRQQSAYNDMSELCITRFLHSSL